MKRRYEAYICSDSNRLFIKEYQNEIEISSILVSSLDEQFLTLFVNLIYEQGRDDEKSMLDEKFSSIPMPV